MQVGTSVQIASQCYGTPSLDVKHYIRLVGMTCRPEGFLYENLKILNVDGVSFKSHQRCLPSSPTKKCRFETVPRVSKSLLWGRGGSGLLAVLSVMCKKH